MFKTLIKATFAASFLLSFATAIQAEEEDFNDGVLYPFTSTVEPSSAAASAPASDDSDDEDEDIETLAKQKAKNDRKFKRSHDMSLGNVKDEK